MRSYVFSIAIVASAWATTASAQSVAPPVWARCAGCHSLVAGKPPLVGPHLAGIVGRKAGAVPGYAYSPAMKASGVVWTREALAAFIANPQAVVKGTRMYFPGIADAKDRAAIVAYLGAKR